MYGRKPKIYIQNYRKRILWIGGANKKLRSKFYTGIANAMADQWGRLLEGSR